MAGDWVPLSIFEEVVSGLLTALVFLWLGVTWRVYMNNERRLVMLETYADPRNEDIRNDLLMARFKVMLAEMELRLGNNLEIKRASIESTITQMGNEVVKTIKNGGT